MTELFFIGWSGKTGRNGDLLAVGARKRLLWGKNRKVLRGGSWNNNANNVRTSNRNRNNPTNRNNNVGFRCANTSMRVAEMPQWQTATVARAIGWQRLGKGNLFQKGVQVLFPVVGVIPNNQICLGLTLSSSRQATVSVMPVVRK
jgi:hypothetical protein